MKKLIMLIAAASLAGCAGSTPKGYEADKTLATAADSSMPKWAEKGETQPFWIDDGKVYSVGQASIRGDERVEAGVRISENNARAGISKAVENRMEFVFQQGDENTGMDSRVSKFIGSEVSSITSSQMRAEGQWWRKVAVSEENGDRRIKIFLYSLIVMPEKDFQAAVFKAANKAVAQNQVSAEFKEQLKAQWNRFVEGSPSAPRVPSSATAPVEESTDKE